MAIGHDKNTPANGIQGFPVQVLDYASCCSKCQATAGCIAFAYTISNKNYWAKTSVGPGAVPDNDILSGYNPNKCGGFVCEDGLTLPGYDMSGFPGGSRNDD
ncbi:unnamed protein product [Rotaria socialis]|uniref:Apple domain-containing protein n=1 Tax=Rotaria socialis TaxID=392032 RepID=A0A817PN19_9BILA|nr:unnamed protein product [Rotaria socialis]CAF3319099.1 unnamed protein product [Rotaria socialis]